MIQFDSEDPVEQSEKKTTVFRSVADYKMIYIKSALVGIVTLFAATIAYIVYAMWMFMRKYQPPPGGEVALSLPALFNHPAYWLIALAAFAIGFYWEFRRTM